MFVGVVILFILPDFPHTWRLLSPEMKHVANRRMAIDAAEADLDEPGGMSQLRGLKLAMLDPKTYLIAIAYHGITGATGFQNFFPTLTESLVGGDTQDERIRALLLVAPPYIFMVLWSYVHAFSSDKLQNRYYFFMYPIPIVFVGCFIFMFTNSFGPRYFSLFLLNFAFTMNNTIYAWAANAIPRPPAKRAAALAFMNSIGNMASIWTPYTYWDSQAPHYRPALGVVMGLMAMSGICATILRFILSRENKMLARMEDQDAEMTSRDVRKLERTAEVEGIDIAAARRLQKGHRYIL